MTAERAGDGVVRAAGGAVWRRGGSGLEVLVIHRPHRSDWSLPKGKLDPGESDAEAAVREVEEETGYRCRLGTDLGLTAHIDHRGRPKQVHWWEMQVESGAFTPNDEVDVLRWLGPDEAEALLTWSTDREVLTRLRALLAGTGT